MYSFIPLLSCDRVETVRRSHGLAAFVYEWLCLLAKVHLAVTLNVRPGSTANASLN